MKQSHCLAFSFPSKSLSISFLLLLGCFILLGASSLNTNTQHDRRRLRHSIEPSPARKNITSSPHMSRRTQVEIRECNPAEDPHKAVPYRKVRWQNIAVNFTEYFERHRFSMPNGISENGALIIGTHNNNNGGGGGGTPNTHHKSPLSGGNNNSGESCMHRQERRYGQNPGMQHNVFLQQRFHEYASFHRNHTSTVNLEHDLLRVASVYEEHDVKYIYVDLQSSGLGNRLNVILTGFMLALYTNRILLVHSTEWDIDTLFCQPFGPGSNWLWPESLVDVTKLPRFGDNYMMIRGDMVNELENVINGQNMKQFARFHIWHITYDEQYIIPMFYLDAHMREYMDKLFPARDPGKHLFNFLLHPRDLIWQQILATYHTVKDSADTFTVGLQLRDATMWQEWKCMNYKEWPKETHFFIASLHPGKEILLDNDINHDFCHLYHDNDWKFTQVFMEHSEQHDNEQTAHALHDIWILSMMDELILSPKSTFGYYAMTISGKRGLYPAATNPNVCDSFYHKHMKERSCYRAISYEPCYHRHFTNDYSKINGLSPENLYNNTLERCEDYCREEGGSHLGWRITTLG